MVETSAIRLVPPVSCVEAVRALPDAERDRILRRGLDRKAVATLAGAVSQLSGRSNMAGEYGEYLNAVLQWIESLQQEVLRLAGIQGFLALHQKRWIELRALHADPALDLARPVRFKSHTGSINRQTRSASPTAPYATPTIRFDSRSEILKELRAVHREIVLVRDRFGAECITRIGLLRWMLGKLYMEAGLEEQEAARRRVDELRASRPSLGVPELVAACRATASAEKLLDVLHLSLEHPSSWITDERGRPDQAFTREIDGNFDRLLNPFFEKVHHKPSRLMARASGAMKKGYQGATAMNHAWIVLKAIVALGAIYSAIVALGADAWQKSLQIVAEYTTPDAQLEYAAQFAREQKRKMAIADKTIDAVADREGVIDPAKTFAKVIADYVRENAGDRVALLFSRYLMHWQETGRNDWQPESEADRKRMAEIADLVALVNVQLFNEGPFAGPDGKPQRFIGSAVVERWPWRSETESNLERVMRTLRERDQRTSFPLPEGASPLGFKPPPPPAKESKFAIAAAKIWDRHLSGGVDAVWRNRPLRWAAIFAAGIFGWWSLRREIRRRREFRLVADVDEAPPAAGSGSN